MEMTQIENRGHHERIQVAIDARYVVGLDNGSGRLLGEEETNLKII